MAGGAIAADYVLVGQGAQPGQARRAVPGLLAATLAAGVVCGCAPSGSAAATRIATAHGALIVLANGATRPARAGETVPRGAIVRTDRLGSAVLDTAGRRVELVGGSSLQVLDGTHESLRAGSLVADVRSGSGLTVAVGAVAADVPEQAVVRVDRGFTVRVGVLAGRASVRSGLGRQVGVPALHQTSASGDALPDTAPAPLQLTDDPAELATHLPVVLDDVLLNRWAAGAAGPVPVGVAAVASLAPAKQVAGCPLPARTSELVLPAAIARSSPVAEPTAARYVSARCLRSAGGSWGVVAHLLRTTALRALAAVDRLESLTVALGPVPGTVLPAPAVPAPLPAATTGGSTSTSTGTGTGTQTGTAPRSGSSPPSGGPTAGASPAPSPSPSPSSAPVSTVVGTVSGLMPSPTPSPSPSTAGGGGGLLGVVGATLSGVTHLVGG